MNATKEIEFWDSVSLKQRNWVESSPKQALLDKLMVTPEKWWEPLIGQLKDKKILDIGCGDTYFTAYWNLTGNEAQGSDFSPATVQTNNLLHSKLNLKEDFYLASSEKIDAPDNSIDIIHMRWVVHHIPPELQDASLQEMMRVLKVGGKILAMETNYFYPFRWIVQTPFLERFNFLRKYAAKKGWLDLEERALPNSKYIEMFRRNGFFIRKVSYDFTFLSYPVWLFSHNKTLEKLARDLDLIIGRVMPRFFSKDVQIIAEK